MDKCALGGPDTTPNGFVPSLYFPLIPVRVINSPEAGDFHGAVLAVCVGDANLLVPIPAVAALIFHPTPQVHYRASIFLSVRLKSRVG